MAILNGGGKILPSSTLHSEKKNAQLQRFVFVYKFKLLRNVYNNGRLPIHSTSEIFLEVLFHIASTKPLNWERKITTASLDINDITLSFLLSLYATWSVMFLIHECWSPLCRQWNKSTGMFHWISHWYKFLILGISVSWEFTFCNHNSLSVLKSEPQFKLTFSNIFRGLVDGLKAWQEPLICRQTFALKISSLFPKSSLLKASTQIVICASSFSS